ncbi:MAG: hypothetical protein HY317_01175 [Acidobacteria bacterium]|nr:hypothetical protein [Acidobacteriota bacterium]
MRTIVLAAGVLVGVAALPGATGPASADNSSGRPRLSLRATPRVAFVPVSVSVVGELRGGQDVEDLHCPEIEWDWDDGNRSAHESDCAPFDEETVLRRRFAARHVYRGPGVYNVRLTLRRAGRAVAASAVTVDVRGPFDPRD